MRPLRLAAGVGLLAGLSAALLATRAMGAGVPFLIPRSELVAAVQTIGVLPVQIEAPIPNEDAVVSMLEEDIVTRLRLGGFTVVAPSAMRAIRARGATSLEGVYDPLTGLPIAERMEALQEFSAHEYTIQHPVDATLSVAIVRRRAIFKRGTADWDGVREQLTSTTGPSAALHRMISAASAYTVVPALSLAVSLVNARGETLYSCSGGLLVLEYPTPSGQLAIYDLQAVERDTGIENHSLLSRAVSVALDPLATGVAPAERLSFAVRAPAGSSKTATTTLKDLLRDHKRLALASLEFPESDLPVKPSERIRARYRELLTAKFAVLGFDVAGGTDFDDLWRGERAAAGGFYDRFSGHLDLAKLTGARARVISVLRERYNVSAVLTPHVIVRQAPAHEGYAIWDGVKESVANGTSLFNNSPANPNFRFTGDLDAFSLELRIIDDKGTVLFERLGGLQLTQHVDHGRPTLVPAASLFAKPGNDSMAIAVALQGLFQRPSQSR